MVSCFAMSTEDQDQLRASIAALEAQRDLLGDKIVEASIAALHAQIAALAEPPQSLRQVTILFMDVVGSTTLAQRLDPETVSTVMDGALVRATAVVERHGGRVLQYAGDNVLAAFGAASAREDDTERAVRCGLDLLALGRVLGAEVLAAHRHAGFDVRVGVHIGDVLLGGGVDAEGTIRGSAVNVAARMEQAAPPGGLRVSQEAFALVRGLFDAVLQPPLAVKGLEAPVSSYLVHGVRPRAARGSARGIEGVVTRMVGREAELTLLQQAFGAVCGQRRLSVVTIVADAGVGKSRLLQEFESWCESQPEPCLWLRGSATPATESQPYGLLRDVIVQRFKIADDDRLEVARNKIQDGIVPLFSADDGPDLAEAHAHLLGHLLGIDWRDSRHIQGIVDEAAQLRSRALHAATQLFRRLGAAENRPVVLHLEDLHWADGESLDFLEQMVLANHDAPLLLLGLARASLFERLGRWPREAAVLHRIDLAPLDEAASQALAADLLQKLPAAPEALSTLLTRSAEGNPFYMEEVLRLLIDQGAVRPGEPWTVDTERLRLTRVPPTLSAVIQARLDGLPAAERRALQQASIVGTVFWDRALASVDPQAEAQLPALTRRELALPRDQASLEGLREYAFRHQLLHQVTYGTVLRRDRQAGHARVARWLADVSERGGPRGGDLFGLAAAHFTEAGDAANAAEFHARAAEHASQRLAHERTLAHAEQALGSLDKAEGLTPRQRADIRFRALHARERTLSTLGRREEELADIEAMEAIAAALDDPARHADVQLAHFTRAMRMSDWAAVEAAGRRLLAVAQASSNEAHRVAALRVMALARIRLGDPDTGEAMSLGALPDARRLGLTRLVSRLLVNLVVVAEWRGDRLKYLTLQAEALQASQDCGDRIGEAVGRQNLGFGWMNLGNLARARAELEPALALARANGDRVVEAWALNNLSRLALWEGDAPQALELARAALGLAVATHARVAEALALMRQGDSECMQRQWSAAEESLTRALSLTQELKTPFAQDVTEVLARVVLAQGRSEEALQLLQPLLAAVAAGGSFAGAAEPLKIELTCHRVLSACGDPRAEAWLERAHSRLMQQADTLDDPALRESFVKNIPAHRDIAALWQRRLRMPGLATAARSD